MSSQENGPSRSRNKRDANIFAIFSQDSDSEDDLDIPHVSESSGSSSDSSDEEDRPRSRTSNQERVDKFGWSKIEPESDRVRADPNFLARKSVANIPDDCEKPIDFFSLFFTLQLMNNLLTETNRYARQFLDMEPTRQWIADHPNSRYASWPPEGITMTQLRQYLGLLLNMGLNPKKTIKDFWSTRPSQSQPFFSSVMSINLFYLIHRMLHCNNSETEIARGNPGFDPWAKVRVVLDTVNSSSKTHYTPSQNVSIDESMIGMKNGCAYIQYMPNKRHARFGIQLYGGKDFDIHHDEGQAFAVVKSLMEKSRLLNKGYKLYTDNFYTKPKLAEFLEEKKTLLTGTVRANSKGLPEGVSAQLQVGQTQFWRKGQMVVAAFRQKKSSRKPVLVLSTAHNAEITEKTVRGKVQKKPAAIFDYNSFMGGVDVSDKQIYHYASERSTRRYWKKIFQNLLDISILNSWIIFKMSLGNSLKRDKFLISVIECLCEPEPAVARPMAVQVAAPAPLALHELVRLPDRKEKDCFVCSDRTTHKNSSAGRKRSRFWCPVCKVGCHERCEKNLIHVTNQGLQKRKRILHDADN
ncbi:PiggyBac transposable element-derived protein 4 [Plakobranchus ocellatus]|uniref:PiggyBac transposable element-derived protein 4 n=1 Tax=Plakobranchus ocellatus TaxID=259542 RepID=A0AAV4A4P2_9GAST|nr:PiggyBac transposable element-derived protein 4 [Plakobranchus ocellatus]